MLDRVISRTAEFLEKMPKAKRKAKGQFFTARETARFMASLFDFSRLADHVEILDPGTGTGILAAAVADRLIEETGVKSIHLTCYENDPEVLSVLQENLEYIKSALPIRFAFTVYPDHYILLQADDFEGSCLASDHPKKYDIVIGNPPYLRIGRNDPAALSMPSVVYGAPNMYFLFTAMSLFNLKSDCEMVYIIPRSWTSGEYFKTFRNYLLRHGVIEHIHLFVRRDKVFSHEQVLQETIILKLKKSRQTPACVTITSSQTNDDFSAITSISIPYNSVVAGKNLYVYLPTTAEEIAVIQKINRYQQTLPDIGFRMKTGIVVDFRHWEALRKEAGAHILPLFYAQHIREGRVFHTPSGKEYDWIVDEKPGLIQKNKNYVFCKRFTAKEERRRLQCGVYLASDFPEYDHIGTQNKINFVDRLDGENLSLPQAYGIYALLNSTLFDKFYRILNGSTQVNSTEVNNISVPPCPS